MEVVASLSQGRTAAAQFGLFTHKSVPVIFEPPCIMHANLIISAHLFNSHQLPVLLYAISHIIFFKLQDFLKKVNPTQRVFYFLYTFCMKYFSFQEQCREILS